MIRLMLVACLFLISCSRVYVERKDILSKDKVSLLQVNATFKAKDLNGARIYFLPIDLSLLDSCPECLEIKKSLKISFDERWNIYIDGSTKDRLTICPQSGDANCIASIRIEKIHTQNPLKLLNPLGDLGKIITYTVRIVDKQTNVLLFGMKGEWIYSSPESLALLAANISTKMIR